MNNKNAKNSGKSKRDIVKESGLTYDDYASLDDGNLYELVEGKLELMSPAPTVTHQMVSFEMQKNIARGCESDYIILYAPVDVILSANEVRQPDLVLVHRKRMDILSKRGVEGAPDLVVEIISPSTLKRDKIDKLKTYAYFHVPEYWIVDPENGILEQYVLLEGRYDPVNIFQENEAVISPNIPCISFTMAAIMDNIPRLADE